MCLLRLHTDPQVPCKLDMYHNKCMTCRSTELRLACSPDEEAHMIVREPAQCMYIITVYLPGLCQATQGALLNSVIPVIHDEL